MQKSFSAASGGWARARMLSVEVQWGNPYIAYP